MGIPIATTTSGISNIVLIIDILEEVFAPCNVRQYNSNKIHCCRGLHHYLVVAHAHLVFFNQLRKS